VRQLACAVAVAVFGTIMLAAAGVSTTGSAGWGRGMTLALPSGVAMKDAYEYVFFAAAFCIAIALFNLARMEERKLRSSVASTTTPAASAAD
jgi:hypothetical protein